jgi:hypothetical protein
MAKGDNYGGIPGEMIKAIMDDCTGVKPAGLTDADVIEVMKQLIYEEHAAVEGGSGQTGFIDAIALFDELRTLVSDFHDAPSTGKSAAASALALHLKKIGEQWKDVGPVHPAFYTFK